MFGNAFGNRRAAPPAHRIDAAELPKLVDALLDGAAAERRPNSRLSCQIKMTPELDGLELRLPDRQT